MTILHKGANTEGHVWDTDDLVQRQLGINVVDGTLHIRKSDDSFAALSDFSLEARMLDGMAYDKPSMTIVDDTGLQLDIEEIVSGGDMDFLVDGVKSTLDCTTGSGVSGAARVALTAGTDANNPATNYIYVTDSSGVATLIASTTLPTGAFGWIGKVIVPDATTWATTGAYGFQRYTEAFCNSDRGALSHEREKLRALGAIYISGVTQTLNITGSGPNNVHLATGAGSVYQLHRQSFPAFSTGPYYYGNGTDAYAKITDLNACLETTDGSAFSLNDRFNLVIWGAVNISSGECKLFVNLPTDIYRDDSQAQADSNNYSDYSVPDDLRSVAFMISRIAMKYTTVGGGAWTELGVYSLLGTPVGVRSGGAGAVATNHFDDSQFRIYDNSDDTKHIALEASSITTATTRTITMADQDIDLTPTSGTYAGASDYLLSTGGTLTGNLTIQTTGAPSLILKTESVGGAPGIQYKDSDSKIRGWTLYDNAADDLLIQKRSAAQVVETSIVLDSTTITLDSNTVVEGTLQPELIDYQGATNERSSIVHNTGATTGPVIHLNGTAYATNAGAIDLVSSTQGETGIPALRLLNYDGGNYDNLLTVDDTGDLTVYGAVNAAYGFYATNDTSNNYSGGLTLMERTSGYGCSIVFENTAGDNMAALISKNPNDGLIFRAGESTADHVVIDADGAVKTPVKYTKAHIGDTDNSSQIVSTSYLKSMVDYTDRGDKPISATSTYTFPAGIWTFVCTSDDMYLEMYYGSAWSRDANKFTGGTIISDGSNVRLYNSNAATKSIRFLTQGLQR